MTTYADLRLPVSVHPSFLPPVRDPWLRKWRDRRLAQHRAAVLAMARVYAACVR